MSMEEGEEEYRRFLSDLPRFEQALVGVIGQWKHSCEHYLSNVNMNRIAWLGQAAVCFAMGIPSCCRGGYHRMTDEQQQAADGMALKYLNKWLIARGEKELGISEALSRTEMNLY
jgi:hypothetical protein